MWTYLSNGTEQLPVAEDDDQERHDQAEDEQADDVRNVVGCLGCPVHGAGCAGTLWAIAAPAEQRRYGPDEGVDPGQDDAQRDFAVVGRVGLSRRHHGAVALKRQDGQGNQGHDTCKTARDGSCISRSGDGGGG